MAGKLLAGKAFPPTASIHQRKSSEPGLPKASAAAMTDAIQVRVHCPEVASRAPRRFKIALIFAPMSASTAWHVPGALLLCPQRSARKSPVLCPTENGENEANSHYRVFSESGARETSQHALRDIAGSVD